MILYSFQTIDSIYFYFSTSCALYHFPSRKKHIFNLPKTQKMSYILNSPLSAFSWTQFDFISFSLQKRIVQPFQTKQENEKLFTHESDLNEKRNHGKIRINVQWNSLSLSFSFPTFSHCSALPLWLSGSLNMCFQPQMIFDGIIENALIVYSPFVS